MPASPQPESNRLRLILSRIVTAIVFMALAAFPICLLGAVRYKYHYSPFLELHEKSGAPFSLPLILRLFWPFAAVGWWSYVAPVAFGIGMAARVRKPLRWPAMLSAVCGTAVLWSVVWSSFFMFARYFSYMGVPAEDLIEPRIVVGNIFLMVVSIFFATLSFASLCRVRRNSSVGPP